MTKAQVIAVREEFKKSSMTFEVVFSSDHALISRADALIWDDTNEIVYAVRSNNDHDINAYCPIAVAVGPYDAIQYMKGMYTMAKFSEVVDTLFAGLITADEKAKLLTLVDVFRIHAIKPIRPEPYYTSDPLILPNAPSTIKRDDGKVYKETNGFEDYAVNPVPTPPAP